MSAEEEAGSSFFPFLSSRMRSPVLMARPMRRDRTWPSNQHNQTVSPYMNISLPCAIMRTLCLSVSSRAGSSLALRGRR